MARLMGDHARCWAHRVVVPDPAHVVAAAVLRADFNQAKASRGLAARRAARHGVRRHDDGTTVALRALPDYDALFGVDFDPVPTLGAPTVVDEQVAPRTSGEPPLEQSVEQSVPACVSAAGDQPQPAAGAVALPRTLVLPPSAVTR